ncbi:hypothetical protein Bbelb_116670 [Branchiostoma belcheri]|nr:hypothetical protein Bbelb_116670 [Branchiostoma belcheri]
MCAYNTVGAGIFSGDPPDIRRQDGPACVATRGASCPRPFGQLRDRSGGLPLNHKLLNPETRYPNQHATEGLNVAQKRGRSKARVQQNYKHKHRLITVDQSLSHERACNHSKKQSL